MTYLLKLPQKWRVVCILLPTNCQHTTRQGTERTVLFSTMKLLVVSGKPLLCLYALRDVEVDEDIRYHYGAGFFSWRKKKYVFLTWLPLMCYCCVQVIFYLSKTHRWHTRRSKMSIDTASDSDNSDSASTQHFTKFIVIQSIDERLSPILDTQISLAAIGTLTSVKTLRSGAVLAETSSKTYKNKLLNLSELAGVPVKVTEHIKRRR